MAAEMTRLVLLCTILCGVCDAFNIVNPIISRKRCILNPVLNPILKSRQFYQLTDLSFILKASSKEDNDSIPPPPPSNGKGEWSDWDTDGYVEEPYEPEDQGQESESIPSFEEFNATISISPSVVRYVRSSL
jgi:hypothetical protein